MKASHRATSLTFGSAWSASWRRRCRGRRSRRGRRGASHRRQRRRTGRVSRRQQRRRRTLSGRSGGRWGRSSSSLVSERKGRRSVYCGRARGDCHRFFSLPTRFSGRGMGGGESRRSAWPRFNGLPRRRVCADRAGQHGEDIFDQVEMVGQDRDDDVVRRCVEMLGVENRELRSTKMRSLFSRSSASGPAKSESGSGRAAASTTAARDRHRRGSSSPPRRSRRPAPYCGSGSSGIACCGSMGEGWIVGRIPLRRVDRVAVIRRCDRPRTRWAMNRPPWCFAVARFDVDSNGQDEASTSATVAAANCLATPNQGLDSLASRAARARQPSHIHHRDHRNEPAVQTPQDVERAVDPLEEHRQPDQRRGGAVEAPSQGGRASPPQPSMTADRRDRKSGTGRLYQ